MFFPQRPTAGENKRSFHCVSTHTCNSTQPTVYLYAIEGRRSRRRALGSPAFHLAVVKFLCDLPLVSCGGMAVGVELDLSLGLPLASCVARILEQVVVVVLVVVCFLKRSQSFQICCHSDGERLHLRCQRRVESRSESTDDVSLCLYTRDHVTAARSPVPLKWKSSEISKCTFARAISL